MKKLYMALFAGAFMLAGAANAETVKGQVVDTENGLVTVESNNQQMTMKTTDSTKYRKRKMVDKDKMKHGRMYKKGDAYYKPLVEDKDWVEIIYVIDPQTKEMLVEEIVVLDD